MATVGLVDLADDIYAAATEPVPVDPVVAMAE